MYTAPPDTIPAHRLEFAPALICGGLNGSGANDCHSSESGGGSFRVRFWVDCALGVEAPEPASSFVGDPIASLDIDCCNLLGESKSMNKT